MTLSLSATGAREGGGGEGTHRVGEGRVCGMLPKYAKRLCFFFG